MTAFAWLSDSLALRLVQALLHFVWQGFAVVFLTVLAGNVLKRAPARARYWLYAAALGMMVACVPITFALIDFPNPGVPTHLSMGQPAPDSASRGEVDRPAVAGRFAPAVLYRRPIPERPTSRDNAAAAVASVGRFMSWLTPVARQVTAAYFLGVALMTLRLAVALNGGRRLRRSAIPVDDEHLLELFERAISRMRVKIAPAIAFCEQITIPIVTGIVRPAILLPAALASGLSPDQLQAILAHELAHIQRFDLVVNLLQRLAEAVLFFHPAVWFVSRRVSREREIAVDDMVLASGWQPANYADALLRMAELSSALRDARFAAQSAALAAWGRGESEFRHRVLRLVAIHERPLLRLTGTGIMVFLTLLVLVALAPLCVEACGRSTHDSRIQLGSRRPHADAGIDLLYQPYTFRNESGRDDTHPGAPSKGIADETQRDSLVQSAPPREPASQGKDSPKAAPRRPEHPRIILARHVLLWDNQILTWDQVVARLRKIRESGPFRATFYSTNGLVEKQDGWKDYHDRIMALYRELFEPVGVSFASVSPRASGRYDTIRTADDLRPDFKRAVSGQVVTPLGEPARDAQVIVLPIGLPAGSSSVVLSGTEIRDPLDEEWSPTDEKGHFVVYPKNDSYSLAILHASGFATQAGPAKDELIRLEPWASIVFTSTGNVVDQQANITISPMGARPADLGFEIFSIRTKGKPLEVKVPAGEIVLSRSLDMGNGVGISLPVEEFGLKPGESREFELKPPSPADRKHARDVYERLHGRGGNDR